MKKAVFVVTKSQGSDTTLAQHIKKLGYAVEVNPAIETRAMLSPEAFTEMRSKIQQALYEGIVFTSVRAVHILAQQNGFPFPEYLPIFAQSESTALAVKENFGRQALIPHDRFVSEAVADLVAHQLNAGAVVCFPAAKETSGGFLARAQEQGIEVDHWPVYETVARVYARDFLKDLSLNYDRVVFIVQSPSAVESIVSNYQQYGLTASGCGFVSVGPKTSAAVSYHALPLLAEAAVPSNASILASIRGLQLHP